MLSITAITTGLCCALGLMSLGGGFYEMRVVDAAWPARPALIQPGQGGIVRRRFWIPIHVAFEIALLASLVAAWPHDIVRQWLLLALASHAAMRVWSVVDFIPKALAFERLPAETVDGAAARRWTARSRWRLLLDMGTCLAATAAFVAALQPA